MIFETYDNSQNRKKIFLGGQEDIKINRVNLSKSEKNKKNNYKVISISLYNEELEFIDNCIDALTNKGIKHISRSKIIRYALEQLDLGNITN